jgi:hypothetical protein
VIPVIIDALSAHINAELHAKGYPLLTPTADGQPGRIVVGNYWQYDQLPPPRILFMPSSGGFRGRDNTRGPVPIATNVPRPDADSLRAMAQHALMTEDVSFDVFAWSIADDDIPDSGMWDFVFTQALYHQIIASMQVVMPGCYTVAGGKWQTKKHLTRAGREFVFKISIAVPVLRQLTPTQKAKPVLEEGRFKLPTVGLPHAPSGVAPHITDRMTLPTGESSAGCEESES